MCASDSDIDMAQADHALRKEMRALQLHCNDIDAHEAALDAQICRLDRAREQVESHLRDKDEGEQVCLALRCAEQLRSSSYSLAKSKIYHSFGNAVGVQCYGAANMEEGRNHMVSIATSNLGHVFVESSMVASDMCCRLILNVLCWMVAPATTGHLLVR